jgi:hypothetical protein
MAMEGMPTIKKRALLDSESLWKSLSKFPQLTMQFRHDKMTARGSAEQLTEFLTVRN